MITPSTDKKRMQSFRIKLVVLLMLLCGVVANETRANGCSGSSFTLTYSPFCGCWQLCGGYGNALLISDCDDLTDLSINWGDGSPPHAFSFGGALPCHDYAPGTYTAVLHIEGYCHSIFGTQTCNISQTITVSPSTINFAANFAADTVCQGSGVTTFRSLSPIAPGILNANWFYDFGDGTTSIGNPNPVHFYDSCGAYDVMMVLMGEMLCCDQQGRDTFYKRVYVDCPPNTYSNAEGDTDPYIYESWGSVTMNEVCLTDPTNFNLTLDDSITIWNYTFADGGSSTLLNPTHTFSFCPPFSNWVQIALTNTRGCTNTINDTAVVHCPVYANFANTTGTLCSGDCNGTATINITGGTPNYTIQWGTNPPQNTLTATNLCPGSYSVTVSDNYNCRDTQTLNVFSPNPFTGTITATDIACHGWLTGTAVINMIGGTPPNTFYWSPGGDTSQIADGLAPGTYSVTATDANGCTFTTSTSIGQPPPVTATFTHTDSHCGACDGSATVTAVGGLGGPYTYLWPATGQTTATATGLCSGIYFVEVTDITPGCTWVFSVPIGNIGAAPVSVTPVNVSCANTCDGTATVSIPGCPLCTFEWLQANGTSLGQTTVTAVNLCAGDYIVRATNPGDGCQSLANFSITVPNPITRNATATGITCNNLCDGTASVTVSGGTPNYSYQWRDAGGALVGATATIGSLCPGVYTVLITDQAGCTSSDTVTVDTYVFSGITTATAISCFGDCNAQILATPQIGTPPYNYQWASGGTPIGTNSPILANLCAGTYDLTITDNTGCAITLPPVTINQPPAITATTSSTPAVCHGECNGTATVVAAGGTPGYTYQWANAQIVPVPSATASTFTNICAGLYHVQITDTNNCTSPWTPVTVTEPDSLVLTLITTQPHCGNGGVGNFDLTASGGVGGFSFQWSTGETTEDITNITTVGVYCVTATDGNGCSASICDTVVQPAPLATTISAASRNGYNVDCFGDTTGTIFLNVTGGITPYTYTWNDTSLGNTNNQFNLSAGFYSVTVTDATGCIIVDTITLIQPPPLQLTPATTANLCAGDSSASISISITGGVPVSPQLPYAVHWVYLTDTSVHINDTSTTITDLIAGQYYVFAFDTMACIIRDTIEIIDPPQLQASFSIVNGSCAGGGSGSIDLTPVGGTPGYTYAWSWSGGTSANQDLTGLAPDSYFVTITDTNGCQVTDTAVVIEPTPLTIDSISSTPTTCFEGSDGTIELTVSGGSPAYMYQWNLVSDTTEDLTGIPSGNYQVVVTDQGGCTATAGIFVDQPSPLPIGAGSLQVCVGDSAFLGGVWQNIPGTYRDTVVSAGGCDSIVDITLSFVDSFVIPIARVICPGDSILINGVQYFADGTYRIRDVASGGCDSIIVLTLDVLSPIGLRTDPADSTTIIVGESVTINVLNNSGVTISDYQWTVPDGLSCTDCPSAVATPEVPLTYTIVASVEHDSVTCYDTTSIKILLDIGVQVYIPNAFTPNGDGVNDLFMIYGRGFKTFRLKIYDRWGEKLFESTDQNVGWDGVYRNKLLNPGVYVYHADIEFIDGSRPPEYTGYWKGSVTLIR